MLLHRKHTGLCGRERRAGESRAILGQQPQDRLRGVIRIAPPLTLSADEETLLCAQTTGPDVLAFPILPGGRLGPGERYGPVLGLLQEPGKPAPDANDLGYTDGVGLDAEGNVWVCLPAANKVVAITPSKAVVTLIHDPSGEVVNHPTNVTWGGDDLKDLYIGSIRAGYVLKARSPIAGAPLIHQR